MNLIRRTLSIDPSTDARLRELAAERGQDEQRCLAAALALLDSVVDIGIPAVAEDRAASTPSGARARSASPLQ